MGKPLFAATVLLTLGSIGAARGQAVQTVMSGLDSPRGMAFGPDGALYVTEAGSGGSGPSISGGAGPLYYGNTSSLSRLLDGVQQRVLTGLPSLAGAGGTEGTGLQDIAFDSTGKAYGLFGYGADPSLRSSLGGAAAVFGQVVSLPLAGGAIQPVADLAAYEAAKNPDGADVNSNPYRLLATAGGFVAVDAGGNDVLKVGANGSISTLAVLPALPISPTPGSATYQAVPTSIALGTDKAYYVSEFTGVPFPKGAADVFRIDPTTGAVAPAFTGFTNIIGLTFGSNGDLYVLDYTTNGLISPSGPGPGELIQVDPSTGLRTIILNNLVDPSGLIAGPDGALYLSVNGGSLTDGAVIRVQVSSVPEPGSWALLGSGLLAISACAARRSGRNRSPRPVDLIG